MTIYAKERGIIPGEDISEKLIALNKELSRISGEKTVVFEPGEYYLTAENCVQRTLFITNTAGDREYSRGEIPHIARVGYYLENISDLTVRAEGAVFILDGKMTNAAIINCSRIEIDGLEIKCVNPDEHEFTVLEKTSRSVTFKLDDDSKYVKENGKFFFVGRDYKTSFLKYKKHNWGWFGKISADNENHIERVAHLFAGAFSIKEVSQGVFKATYASTSRFNVGERYCFFGARRQHAGIFVDRSSDIVLKNIKERFSYSLALVVQNTENITVDSADFSPAPDSDKKLASIADFIQVCMCRGKVSVTNSYFCGAGDDTINVHGMHFCIKAVKDNKITVRFMHPQSHGYNALREGDIIEYVNPLTLLPLGKAEILESRMLNEKEIELTVSNADKAMIGRVIEDITACPDFYFGGNKMTRIITRGILVTTRGKVLIEKNDFDDTQMATILASDDAKSWFESGRCTDVTIRENRFGYSGAYNVQILPENGLTKSVVHGDFIIENNDFDSEENGGIDAHSSASVVFRGNRGACKRENFVKLDNITRSIIE